MSAKHIKSGQNTLEFVVLGVAPLKQWKTTRKNFVSLWDIEIHGLDNAGPRTVGNGSWADVSFIVANSSTANDLVPSPAQATHSLGAHPLGELFGGSNRPYSQLAHVSQPILWSNVF